MSRVFVFRCLAFGVALGLLLSAALRADDPFAPAAPTPATPASAPPAVADLPDLKFPPPAEKDVAVAEKRIWEALQRPMSVEYDETPLAEVMAYFEHKLGVPVVIDKQALEAVGAQAESPVTVHASNLQARSALNILLKPLDLTWTIRDEVLYITTPEEAGSKLRVKVYALHDLIGPGAAVKPGPSLKSFMEQLQNTVAPESWDQVGGKGAVRPFGDEPILMIAQTIQIHDEIEQLLAQLRAARNGAAK